MFKDFITLAGKRKGKLIASCIFSTISPAISIIPFFLIYIFLLELLNPSLSQVNIWSLVILLPLIYIIMYITLIYAYDLSHRAAYEILYDVRIQLGERMTRLSLGYFNEKNTGEIETIMNENVERLEFFLAHHLPEMIATIIVPTFLAIFLFILDWRMALVSIFPVLLALVIVIINGRKWGKLVEKFLTAQSKVNSTIVEYTQSIAVIKAFNQTAESFEKYEKNMATWRDNLLKWSKESAISFTLYQAFISSTLVVIIPVGIWLYNQNALTLEIFLLFLILGPLFGALFVRIYQFLRYWLEEKECMDRVNKLRYAPIIVENIKDKNVFHFDITFKDVSFSYEGDENFILHDINFHIPQGSVCAFVGPSGAGKTTIIKLIPRFWDIENGEILIGECNIKDLPLEILLSNISLVFQDVFLFNDTIFENIRLGKPEATQEEVKDVAHAARCNEFIEKLPDAYSTIIGERGVKLSAGERQRISIARALLKDAPIIILDEATVFIDPENETLIQEAINNLRRGKTMLIIAHRLSTIINVDQIVVVENGRIIERGNHGKLLKEGGVYNKMWNAHISTLGWKIGGDKAKNV